MDKNLEALPLWKKFKKDAKDTINYTNVQELVKKASNLLNQINETFPNYTLHNSEHSLNLVRIMGDLLGKNGIKKLTTFETAILILSAYYHDIGMVFSREDKKYIGNEEDDDFQDFLERHIDAKLIFQKNKNKLNENLAEWYCRWIHPKRVFYFLKDNKELLQWKEDGNSFFYTEELGLVCNSHGENIKYLIDNEKISINYKSEHDLKFCSLILRCADILDFDSSRTPEEVYNYLGLDNPIDTNEEYSRTQWQAHLCSNGFKVTKNKTLFFDAEPIHPAVEYDVRKFLIIIQNELRNSFQALIKCSKKWQDFDLIYEIEEDIQSQGYIYGEHKFELDQNEVLNLLMGENLYADNYVFLREVLQNAIDTSRHREVYEKSENYKDDFKVEAINITEWIDQDGYRWIRVDDFGMGMTKEKIENYFLKIGKSYYESNDFESELLGYKDNKGFKPISRFGIGILSCFIVSDKIEVSTKAINSNPIRLSLEGLNGFFVMQQKDEFDMNDPNIMPNKKQDNELYRKEDGSSIAIRIDPSKEMDEFNLNHILQQYVLCPPIEIKVDDVLIECEIKKKLELKKDNCEISEGEEVNKIKKYFNYSLDKLPIIEVKSMDISEFSPNKQMKGVLTFYILRNALDTEDQSIYLYKYQSHNKLYVRCANRQTQALQLTVPKLSVDNLKFSHNGIKINTEFEFYSNGKFHIDGIIQLYDSFRIDLPVSRDVAKVLDWKILSNLEYIHRKILKKTFNINSENTILKNYKFHMDKIIVKYLKNDPLLENWLDEYNIKELLLLHKNKSTSVFYNILYELLIDIKTHTKLKKIQSYKYMSDQYKIEESDIIYDKPKSLEYYTPLLFTYYHDDKILKIYNVKQLNINHIFSQWLLLNTEKILKKYKSLFYSIRENISQHQMFNYNTVNILIERLYSLDSSLFEVYSKDKVLLNASNFELPKV